MKYNKILIVLSFLIYKSTLAQRTPQVHIIARADSTGKIYLRWAATNSSTWKRCNLYGFKLERYTVLRNKKLLEKPELELISKGVFKPKPIQDWKALAEKNHYAAILAQALYGKDFEVNNTSHRGITKIIAQSQEQEQRFSFALYAADMCFEAALLAGWGIIDYKTNQDEKYLYRLITAAPAKELKPDTTSIFISPADYEPLPIIDDIASQFGNRTVMLNWDSNHLLNYYTSYFIEKSVDQGKSFKRLEGAPISNLNPQTTRLYFMDSLSANNVEYRYRIGGINSFGQEGPFSESIIGYGQEMLAFVPGIETAFVNDEGILQIDWTFEPQANELIKGFIIHRSDQANGTYFPFTDTLGTIQRKIHIQKPLESTNYFTITAIPHHGEKRTSFPTLVQLIDTIPPLSPNELKVTIDTSGIVSLTWEANREKDILGYKIYRALKEGEDLVPLTDSVWLDNHFKDQLSFKLLNKKVWYGVSALDQRFNQSPVTPLIELKKPNKIPPSPPILIKYEIKRDSLSLTWINSTDDDIKLHRLYRKSSRETSFTEVFHYSGQQDIMYTDLALQAGEKYTYYLQAENEELLSTPSERLTIHIPISFAPAQEIMHLFAYPQKEQKRIQIVWEDHLHNVVEYQVYRATKGAPLSLWKIVTPPQKGIYDTDVQLNSEYEYATVAVLQSGRYSSMKKVIAKL